MTKECNARRTEQTEREREHSHDGSIPTARHFFIRHALHMHLSPEMLHLTDTCEVSLFGARANNLRRAESIVPRTFVDDALAVGTAFEGSSG